MDKKLTDLEIVKALECCARPLPHCYCDECPAGANGGCAIKTENIIDLINRLQTENEKLSQFGGILLHNGSELFKELQTAKAEAYKEFAERLKMRAINRYNEFEDYQEYPYATITHIDELLKELVGEDK